MKILMTKGLNLIIGCVLICGFGAISHASEVKLLVVDHKQIVAALPDQGIIVYGSNHLYGNYGWTQLSAVQTTAVMEQSVNGSTTIIDEQVGGTGESDPIDNGRSTDTKNNDHWGSAEILFNCHSADMILYRNINGKQTEILATSIPTQNC